MMNANNELHQLSLDAFAIALRAGLALKRMFRHVPLDPHTKGSPFDIVTAADRTIDRMIVEFIKNRHPNHAILTEESGQINPGAEWQWVIDPIDGTTNFSAGLPHFNISIGIKRNGDPQVGVVYDPVANRCFSAVKGGDAYCNGKKLAVSTVADLSQAVVTTGFPYDRAVNPDNNIDIAAGVAKRVRGLRLLGSAALDICFVAAGWIDAFWEMELHEWDVCAALLIARQAGAVVTPYRHDRQHAVLVANPQLTQQLLPLITPA